MSSRLADIILPLPVKGRFTYRIPDNLDSQVSIGSRVIVQFGSRKFYSGIVALIHSNGPEDGGLKEISDVPDQFPVINELNLKFWEWMASYYMAPPGDILKAALPSGLCLESETVIRADPSFRHFKSLDKASMTLLSIIEDKGATRLKNLPGNIYDEGVIRILSRLVRQGAVVAGESVFEKYKPLEEVYIVLSRKYSDDELNTILDSLSKAPRQSIVLETYLRITGYTAGADIFPVKRSLLLKSAASGHVALASLVKKGIMVVVNMEVSRLDGSQIEVEPLMELSEAQQAVYAQVKQQLDSKKIVLLKGVTSSGKTEIYTHLIAEELNKGKQVLYLLPEIALTTQIIDRLRRNFGPLTGVYHSRLGDPERVEIWRKVMESDPSKGYRLIIGVRSSLFLPFNNLGLIIVDEEHDGSYKQHDPSPRYQARDSAIMMASVYGAVTLLGSATPSVESWFNAKAGKYGLAVLNERFGKVNLPEIILSDTREAYRRKMMTSHFSPELLHSMDGALERGEQVILFRNRRGFSPYIECSECGWIPECIHCSVKLTYHLENNRLVCHYCGSSSRTPVKCNACGSMSMVTRGFGTEKIEDEIKIVFPKARVARMDQDTTRSKDSFNRIIRNFEKGETDILIGTQMISKGLDFENLTVVGILNADSMLNYPDFRAHERAFQMMSQVSGRAGRRQKHGRVVIQTSDPRNKIIRLVLQNDYEGMYNSQIEERKLFSYPPFFRLIKITIRSRDRSKLEEVSTIAGKEMRNHFGERVLGPEYPPVSRVQQWYIKSMLIKIERNKPLAKAKEIISGSIEKLSRIKGASAVRFAVDVDPY